MSFKSFLGWVLLLGVLTVPVFLFYNWRTKMQTPAGPDAAARPSAAGALGGVTMMQGAAGASSASPQGVSTVTVTMTQTATFPASAYSSSGAAAAVQTPALAASSGAVLAASTPFSGKEIIEYAPASTRDPTLSQLDLKMLAKEAYDREMAKHQIIQHIEQKPKVVLKPIEDKLELQGIVATRNGIMALVNGERLKEGDQIMGAVVKHITTRVVVFKYGGRTFTKRVE